MLASTRSIARSTRSILGLGVLGGYGARRTWRLRGVHRAALRVLTAERRHAAGYERVGQHHDRPVRALRPRLRPHGRPSPGCRRAPKRRRPVEATVDTTSTAAASAAKAKKARKSPAPATADIVDPDYGLIETYIALMCRATSGLWTSSQPRTLPDPILGCFISGMDWRPIASS
jgi:hypothetical protein